MPTSIFLARLLGPAYVLVGIPAVLDPDGYRAIAADMLRSAAVLYLAAVLGLIGGLALVLAHNVWIAGWPVLITLTGWIAIFDSASWILAPRAMREFWTPVLSGGALPLVGGAIALIVGFILCYFGYRTDRSGRLS